VVKVLIRKIKEKKNRKWGCRISLNRMFEHETSRSRKSYFDEIALKYLSRDKIIKYWIYLFRMRATGIIFGNWTFEIEIAIFIQNEFKGRALYVLKFLN